MVGASSKGAPMVWEQLYGHLPCEIKMRIKGTKDSDSLQNKTADQTMTADNKFYCFEPILFL